MAEYNRLPQKRRLPGQSLREAKERFSLGEYGERAVAEVLERLRPYGFRVIHDIVRDGYNIDHVVVGPPGVFAIETKFRSGSATVSFRNGQGLFIRKKKLSDDPTEQARQNARDLYRLINEGYKLRWVTPVVVFVGGWRVKDHWQTTNVRVLKTDRLIAYLVGQQPELTRHEIWLIASLLEK